MAYPALTRPAEAAPRPRGMAAAVALAILLGIGLSDSPPPAQAANLATPPLRAKTVVPRVAAATVQPVARDDPPVIFSVGTRSRVVALTFDLDMSPSMAEALRSGAVRSWVDRDALRQLRAGHVAATLFMTGMWAQAYPALARDLAGSGQFEIGNHSYSHPAFHLPCYGLQAGTRAGLVQEVERSQQAIRAVTGTTPAYFRFPGGCLDPGVVSMVRAHRLTPVEWSLNSLDAFNGSAAQIARTVIGGVQPGDIVLMHLMGGPNAPASGAALRQIIPALKKAGYRFVTVGQLLALGDALQPASFHGVVEAPAPPPPIPSVPSVPSVPSGPAVPAGPPYWVWTPWGWQSLPRPPACRWQLSARNTWVCA